MSTRLLSRRHVFELNHVSWCLPWTQTSRIKARKDPRKATWCMKGSWFQDISRLRPWSDLRSTTCHDRWQKLAGRVMRRYICRWHLQQPEWPKSHRSHVTSSYSAVDLCCLIRVFLLILYSEFTLNLWICVAEIYGNPMFEVRKDEACDVLSWYVCISEGPQAWRRYSLKQVLYRICNTSLASGWSSALQLIVWQLSQEDSVLHGFKRTLTPSGV